jgi:hypothetical protein
MITKKRRHAALPAAHDGARLREGPIDQANLATDVWADTAYSFQNASPPAAMKA